MKSLFIFVFVFLTLCASTVLCMEGFTYPIARVYESRGYIYGESSKDKNGYVTGREITTAGRCFDPALSPDKKYVAYVKETPNLKVDSALGEVYANEIWIYNVVEKSHHLLLRGKNGDDIRTTIGDISHLTFSIDGAEIFYLGCGGATTGAIHSVKVSTKKDRYVIDGDSITILNKGKYSGCILALRRDYSGDAPDNSYWVVSSSGKKIKRVCSASQTKVFTAFKKQFTHN